MKASNAGFELTAFRSEAESLTTALLYFTLTWNTFCGAVERNCTSEGQTNYIKY